MRRLTIFEWHRLAITHENNWECCIDSAAKAALRTPVMKEPCFFKIIYSKDGLDRFWLMQYFCRAVRPSHQWPNRLSYHTAVSALGWWSPHGWDEVPAWTCVHVWQAVWSSHHPLPCCHHRHRGKDETAVTGHRWGNTAECRHRPSWFRHAATAGREGDGWTGKYCSRYSRQGLQFINPSIPSLSALNSHRTMVGLIPISMWCPTSGRYNCPVGLDCYGWVDCCWCSYMERFTIVCYLVTVTVYI